LPELRRSFLRFAAIDAAFSLADDITPFLLLTPFADAATRHYCYCRQRHHDVHDADIAAIIFIILLMLFFCHADATPLSPCRVKALIIFQRARAYAGG